MKGIVENNGAMKEIIENNYNNVALPPSSRNSRVIKGTVGIVEL